MGVRRWLRLAVTSLFSLLRQMLDLFVSADLFAGQATYGPYLKESDYFSPSVTSDVLNGRSPSSDPESTMGRALVTLSMRSLRTTALLPRGIQKTLVLDLDETLIHSTTKASRDYDTKIDVALDRSSCTFYVYKRPHVDYFLRQASRWYELVIFTASTAEYAAPVIDWLDPQRLISRRYYREACTPRDGNFLKNLAIIEKDLSRVCIIDNSPVAYSIVPENAIPIEGWFCDPTDQRLLDLLPFLEALRFCNDVRSVLSLRNTE